MRLLLLGLLPLAVSCGSSNSQSESSIRDDTSKQFAWNEKGKDAIRAKLKDPESAQFRNVQFYSAIAPVTCGEVNAKNGFGGFSGYERFIAGGDVITVLESEMASGEMDKSWAQICR